MENTKNRIISIVLTGIMLLSLCSCKARNTVTAEELTDISNKFIELVSEQDLKKAKKLTTGADPYESVDFDTCDDLIYPLIASASCEAKSELRFNESGDEVRLRVKLNCLDYFTLKYDDEVMSSYMSEEQYMEVFNNKDFLTSVNLTLRFVNKDGEWLLTGNSADRMLDRICYGWSHGIEPVTITPEEAEEQYASVIRDIADGNFVTYLFTLPDIETLCPYDNILDTSHSSKADQAREEFVSAYAAYIAAHDYDLENADTYYPYEYTLTGEAPSRDEIYEYIRDSIMVISYAEWFKYSNLGQSYEDTVDNITVALYSGLASKLKYMDSEPYELGFTMTNVTMPQPEILLTSDLIAYPDRALYEAEHAYDPEQTRELTIAALTLLLTQGDINVSQYNEFIGQLDSEGQFNSPVDIDQQQDSLYPNQAVNTEEYVPSFSDGSLIYATSMADENGYWMFYSKENGVLDTVEYYIDGEGIYMTCFFEEDFDKGTELLFDWWIDGEQVMDSARIQIQTADCNRVVVKLPLQAFPNATCYEMRLWNDSHTHVLAYVQLNKA